MHVLAIHMKVMMVSPSRSSALSELWGALTCQWNKENSGKLILRHNNVPLLMQDPLALMTHFILLLPLNVALPFFKTVTRACFNLQMVQTLIKIVFTLSPNERSLLRSEFSQANSDKFSRFSLGKCLKKIQTSFFTALADNFVAFKNNGRLTFMLSKN